MFKFSNIDLKNNLLECIKYIIDSKQDNKLYLCSSDLELDNKNIVEDFNYFQLFKCKGENYTQDEIEILEWDTEDKNEVIIDSDFEIDIYFYDYDTGEIPVSIGEFINAINKCKSSTFDENGVCITDKEAIFRVDPGDVDYINNYDDFPDFEINTKYNDNNLGIYVSNTNIIYALNLYFKDIVDEYNPPIMDDDLFIEISSDKKLDINRKSIYEIYNAYIFEIFASYNIKIILHPRIKYYYEDDELKQFDENTNYRLRPLLFSKGMEELLSLFNNAEGLGVDERSIVEYVKVIEYVSQTVIRMEITEEIRKKLNSAEALNPNAIFISELENMFSEHNNTYNTDRNLIKSTILKCCDIKQLVNYSPKFLKKLIDLDKNLAKPKSHKDDLLNEAYDELCASISDTRNQLSHAKANYSSNGHECPNDQKEAFIVLLRHLCIQIIRWFSNVNESDKIINKKV